MTALVDTVERQVRAYNAHDADAFAACYAADAVLEDMTGAALMRGRDTIRERYGSLFATAPRIHAEIAHRTEVGAYVIDEERVTASPRGDVHGVAIYRGDADGLIDRVVFVQQAGSRDAPRVVRVFTHCARRSVSLTSFLHADTARQREMDVKRAILVATCALAMLGTTASTAFAGEVTGNGKPTAGPDNANSICVFSGQNDDPNAPILSAAPIPEAPNGPGGRTQNYGQDVRYGLLTPAIVTPGMTCRGGSNFDRTR